MRTSQDLVNLRGLKEDRALFLADLSQRLQARTLEIRPEPHRSVHQAGVIPKFEQTPNPLDLANAGRPPRFREVLPEFIEVLEGQVVDPALAAKSLREPCACISKLDESSVADVAQLPLVEFGSEKRIYQLVHLEPVRLCTRLSSREEIFLLVEVFRLGRLPVGPYSEVAGPAEDLLAPLTVWCGK